MNLSDIYFTNRWLCAEFIYEDKYIKYTDLSVMCHKYTPVCRNIYKFLNFFLSAYIGIYTI